VKSLLQVPVVKFQCCAKVSHHAVGVEQELEQKGLPKAHYYVVEVFVARCSDEPSSQHWGKLGHYRGHLAWGHRRYYHLQCLTLVVATGRSYAWFPRDGSAR